jgi:ribosomal-protein-alanine N-acetyltransferase
MFIRTERLFLRPGWPEDMPELKQVLSEAERAHDVTPSAASRIYAELRAYLERPQESRLPQFFINLRDDSGSKLIGSIGLVRSGAEVELRYWIARSYRGMDYAAEAVRAVLTQARTLGHRQVVAAHFLDSEASARVLEKTGFMPTGETRPRFSMVRGAEAPARLYVARFADKLFGLIGASGQPARY